MFPINKEYLLPDELEAQAQAAERAAAKIREAGGFVGAVENLLGVAQKKRELKQRLLDDAQSFRESAAYLQDIRENAVTYTSAGPL